MRTFSKRTISNYITNLLSEDIQQADVLDIFLMMKMSNDMGENNNSFRNTATPADINTQLIGNGIIDSKDIKLEQVSGFMSRAQKLTVRLSAPCSLYFEEVKGTLQVKINDKPTTTMSIRSQNGEDVAMWIVRQKQNMETYMEEWRNVLNNSAKKSKGNRMAALAIKAIFRESMKDCTDIKCEFIEQKRRMRIRVKLPNGNLGVIVDAWWGSYKKRLPQQIEDVKKLLEINKKVGKMDYFVSRR